VLAGLVPLITDHHSEATRDAGNTPDRTLAKIKPHVADRSKHNVILKVCTSASLRCLL
jgi:hypothetical protein